MDKFGKHNLGGRLRAAVKVYIYTYILTNTIAITFVVLTNTDALQISTG